MFATRAGLAEPHFQAALCSLRELLEYARPFQIRLAVENRSHLMDIPIPDEMESILGLADADRIGMTYDVGHAESLGHLGLFPSDEWLKRFGTRIFETHLHDVIGHVDHFAPGLGQVDFAMIARYLPPDAVRVFELRINNSAEQVKAGAQFLEKKGCIRRIL
jgi:sugar phosphate isomerase/epimerase